MGKSITVVVQGELAEEVHRFEKARTVQTDRNVLFVQHLGEEEGEVSGVVLKEGWSFYSHVEIDDEFREGDWVYSAGRDESMKVLYTEYAATTGETVYTCQTYYKHNGLEWRTVRLNESEAIASGKPDYIAE